MSPTVRAAAAVIAATESPADFTFDSIVRELPNLPDRDRWDVLDLLPASYLKALWAYRSESMSADFARKVGGDA